MAKFDKKLSAILAKCGILAEDQRDQAIAAAVAAGKSLTQHVIDAKLATEAGIISAVSEDMNIPPIDIDRVEIDKEALDLVPEDIARRYQVVPVAKIGRTLTLAVANPTDVATQDEVNMVTGCDLMPVVSTDVAIMRAIEKIYGKSQEDMKELVSEIGMDDIDVELAEAAPTDGDTSTDMADSESKPVVKLVQLILAQGVRAGAAGIHIEPYEKRIRVRYRIDGACSEALSPPRRMHGGVVSRIKIMSNMDISEHRKPQDGKFRMKFKDRDIDFRVSILPLVFGEKVVMRILDASSTANDLDSLGFEEKSLADFSDAINAANGMVLVTGPTGCGKTTTLYAALKKIVRVEDNITTVEDPVEYILEGINQVQVSERRGMTFAAALRSILRQDPDIVFIGEIRDSETARIAVQAALTGHLVFSTLHTNDTPSTITRLVNMGVDNFLVASCLILASAQKLVRRLCRECRQAYKPTEEQMVEWCFTDEEIAGKPDLFRSPGCARCGNLGYRGRLPLLETLPLNEDIRDVIVAGGSVVEIKRRALARGMLTLRRVGIINAIRGDTSIEEVLSSTMPDR